MATSLAVVGGILILLKYTSNKYSLGAEHDIIYFYPFDTPVTPEDATRLAALGWFLSEETLGWAVYP